jgi:TPR repeat protein
MAQSALGERYAIGEGVPQDKAEAAKWLQKAAEQGYAEAQLSLGKLYASGEGVPRDQEEANKWLQKAAEQGDVNDRLRDDPPAKAKESPKR